MYAHVRPEKRVKILDYFGLNYRGCIAELCSKDECSHRCEKYNDIDIVNIGKQGKYDHGYDYEMQIFSRPFRCVRFANSFNLEQLDGKIFDVPDIGKVGIKLYTYK